MMADPGRLPLGQSFQIRSVRPLQAGLAPDPGPEPHPSGHQPDILTEIATERMEELRLYHEIVLGDGHRVYQQVQLG